jgi:hypothetical protein
VRHRAAHRLELQHVHLVDDLARDDELKTEDLVGVGVEIRTHGAAG